MGLLRASDAFVGIGGMLRREYKVYDAIVPRYPGSAVLRQRTIAASVTFARAASVAISPTPSLAASLANTTAFAAALSAVITAAS